MPLTPNNREEHWLQGMVDGQTDLTPNKRREYWYKEIVDAIGSGGGGGGGGVYAIDPQENNSVTIDGNTYTKLDLFGGGDGMDFVLASPAMFSDVPPALWFIQEGEYSLQTQVETGTSEPLAASDVNTGVLFSAEPIPFLSYLDYGDGVAVIPNTATLSVGTMSPK